MVGTYACQAWVLGIGVQIEFSKECGGVSALYAKDKTENPLPIAPF